MVQLPEELKVEKLKMEAPFLVKLTGWLLLITGIFSLLGVLPLFLLGGIVRSGNVLFLAIMNLISGVGYVIISFAIRQMRKWSLYMFTGLTVLGVGLTIYSFVTSTKKDLADLVLMSIQGALVAYFWTMRRKFV